MAVTSFILTLLTWTIWRAPTNASKWRMGFNSAFKGLIIIRVGLRGVYRVVQDLQPPSLVMSLVNSSWHLEVVHLQGKAMQQHNVTSQKNRNYVRVFQLNVPILYISHVCKCYLSFHYTAAQMAQDNIHNLA